MNILSQIYYPKQVSVFFTILILCLSIYGCCGLSTQDENTFRNLRELKSEVTTLYETFSQDKVDTTQITFIRRKFEQMYEYEKNKGEDNHETIEQVQIIQKTFDRHIDDRMNNGKWSQTHITNNKSQIAEMFDIAINTESLKSK